MTPAPTGPPRAPIRALVGVLVLFNLMVLGLVSWSLARSRAQQVAHAELTTHNLALVLEQSMTATLRQVDMAMLTIRDEVERPSSGRPLILAHIETQASRLAMVDALGVTDATGQVEYLAGAFPGFHPDAAGEAFFLRFQQAPESTLFISPPSKHGPRGAWAITLARPRGGGDGVFQGVVFATVPLERLTRELAQVDVGRWGTISLRGPGLALLARHPAFDGQDRIIGDTQIAGDYRLAVDSGQRERRFTTFSRLDGTLRTYSFRRLYDPDIYILVGLGQREYLAPWRREAAMSIAGAAALMALSFGTTWVARSAWRRQMEGQAERDRLIQELTQALVEVKKLKGLLPICGHCKKIRDNHGYWNHLESYISEHSDATFTHGVCPDCAQEMRREIQARRDQRGQD